VIAASPARMSSSAKDCVDSEQAYARRRAACRGPRSLSTFLWGTAFDARIEDALDVLTLADLPPGVYRVRPLAVPEDRRGTGPACRIQGPGGNRIRPTPLTPTPTPEPPNPARASPFARCVGDPPARLSEPNPGRATGKASVTAEAYRGTSECAQ
jgi:hypothetical protein